MGSRDLVSSDVSPSPSTHRCTSRRARPVGRPSILLVALVGTALGGVCLGQVITEISVPVGATTDIAAGPDGSIWFTELLGIARVSPSGTFTDFSLRIEGTVTSPPINLTVDRNGTVWFTQVANQIGRLTTDGAISEFFTPTGGSYPLGITSGPDGAVWFTEMRANQIGRITTDGVITEFGIGTPGEERSPIDIVAGPDGGLWFTEYDGNRIGRMTTAGVVTEFAIPTPTSGPEEITAGPDGNLWFIESAVNKIGRITPGGAITEFPVSTAGFLADIAAGPDGNLWFTDSVAGQIGRLTPSGSITQFPVLSGNWPFAIAEGRDGNLWFTEGNAAQIGRITTCAANATTLCLNQGRFDARVSWSVRSEGRSGTGTAVPLTGDTGYFWFFNADNVELVIKVLDGRPINGHFWVFSGALSNVQYTITVTDTQTQTVRTYTNPSGTLASVADTEAF